MPRRENERDDGTHGRASGVATRAPRPFFSLALHSAGATYGRAGDTPHHTTRHGRARGTRIAHLGRQAKGYLLYGPLGRRVRALRLLEQRQDLPESFLLWLPRHFHRVFQQHHCNAQPAFSDLADKRKLPTALSLSLFLSPPFASGRPTPSPPASLCQDRGRTRGRHALPPCSPAAGRETPVFPFRDSFGKTR